MKNILDVMKSIIDKNQPRIELRYVLNNTNGDLVVTNNRVLLVVKTNLLSDTKVLLDVNNINILQNSGFDINLNLPFSNCGSFLEYERTLISDKRTKNNEWIIKDILNISASEILNRIGEISGNSFDYYYLVPIFKKMKNFRVNKIVYSAGNNPLHINGWIENFEFEMVIVPLSKMKE